MNIVTRRRLVALAALAIVLPFCDAARAAPGYHLADGGGSVHAPVGTKISGNGRYVVFLASPTPRMAVNPITGWGAGSSSGVLPPATVRQVYLYDTHTGKRQLVSNGIDGTQGNAPSSDPDITDNGRYVVYASAANNLVQGDINNATDVFVWDRVKQRTRLISVTAAGAQITDSPDQRAGFAPSISGNGRVITFWSSGKVVSGDYTPEYGTASGVEGLYASTRKGVVAVETAATSSRTLRRQICFGCFPPAISGTGRYVAFYGTFLTAADPAAYPCLILRDLVAAVSQKVWCGTPTEVAMPGTGQPARIGSPVMGQASISRDGRVIVFDVFQGTFNASEEDVFRYTVGDKAATQIDGGMPTSYAPTISGNGKRIVYVGRDLANQVTTGETEDGNLHFRDDASDKWSNSNGASSQHFGSSLFLIAGGQAPQQLACSGISACALGGYSWPSLSNDGKTLAVVSQAPLASDDPDAEPGASRTPGSCPDDVYIVHL